MAGRSPGLPCLLYLMHSCIALFSLPAPSPGSARCAWADLPAYCIAGGQTQTLPFVFVITRVSRQFRYPPGAQGSSNTGITTSISQGTNEHSVSLWRARRISEPLEAHVTCATGAQHSSCRGCIAVTACLHGACVAALAAQGRSIQLQLQPHSALGAFDLSRTGLLGRERLPLSWLPLLFQVSLLSRCSSGAAPRTS